MKIWKKKWNIGNLKPIETENGSTEQELQDLEDRPASHSAKMNDRLSNTKKNLKDFLNEQSRNKNQEGQ